MDKEKEVSNKMVAVGWIIWIVVIIGVVSLSIYVGDSLIAETPDYQDFYESTQYNLTLQSAYNNGSQDAVYRDFYNSIIYNQTIISAYINGSQETMITLLNELIKCESIPVKLQNQSVNIILMECVEGRQ